MLVNKAHSRHLLGAPSTDAEALEFMRVINSRDGSDQYAAVRTIDQTNGILTDKSIGLLQADSILVAVATIYLQNCERQLLATASVLTALVCCLVLLLPNLAILWARDPHVYETPTDAFLFSFRAAKARAYRFTLGLWLSAAAFVLLIAAVLARS